MKFKMDGTSQLMLLAILGLMFSHLAHSDALSVSRFDTDGLKGWEVKEFNDETHYELRQVDGSTALIAQANGSASGYVKAFNVDLERMPFLNWEWRANDKLPVLDERSKAGDDYVARLYVIKSGGLFFWNTIALNYVWSSRKAQGEHWDNAYAGSNAKMFAIRDVSDKSNTWFAEKRNVYEDLKNLFGQEIDEIDAIAIMTDADDSGLTASAAYRNIYFSEK